MWHSRAIRVVREAHAVTQRYWFWDLEVSIDNPSRDLCRGLTWWCRHCVPGRTAGCALWCCKPLQPRPRSTPPPSPPCSTGYSGTGAPGTRRPSPVWAGSPGRSGPTYSLIWGAPVPPARSRSSSLWIQRPGNGTVSGVTCLSRGHRVRLSSEEKFAPTASGLGLPSTLHHDARAEADWTSAPRFTVNVMVHIPPFMWCRDCNPRVKSESSGFSTVRPSSSPRFPGSCSRRASPLRAVSLQLESPREKLFHVYHSLTPSTHSSKTRRTRTVWKLLQTHKTKVSGWWRI